MAKLLHLIDKVIDPVITTKALGHQWYWPYQYSDFVNEDGKSTEFDSAEQLIVLGLNNYAAMFYL